MTEIVLPPPIYISTDDALRALVEQLSNEPLLGIDTESNSLYAYRERVCLFQISTRSADYIVDPLTIVDMQPLAPLMANPRIEKVFHASEYDVMCMKRDYNFEVHTIFDTMMASRVCGHALIGLGNLLERYAGVFANKKHQRDDWSERPLPTDSLLYAQMDTHYLPLLRDSLYAELVALDRLEEARELFEELEYVPAAATGQFDPEGYWRMNLPRDMSRRKVAIVRELYLLREDIAQKRDLPPFKIFSNAALVAVALDEPRNRDHLGRVKGMSPLLVRRYGRDILTAVDRGLKAKPPKPPMMPPQPDATVLERFSALREWRKTRAQNRGVESDVIVSKAVLWTLAQKAPSTLDDMRGIPGLGPWRLARYGDELLEIIQRY
jgi:ribonuclease D